MFNKKNCQIILMSAVKRKKYVKNKVNAKFVNFNTVFIKKYHSVHHFCFKSCLVSLEIKITVQEWYLKDVKSDGNFHSGFLLSAATTQRHFVFSSSTQGS